jgi:hypothetical protein
LLSLSVEERTRTRKAAIIPQERKWQRIDKDVEARECSSPPNYKLKENTLYTFL